MSNAKDTNPNPEVPEKAIRRRFTAAYKLRILAGAERCQEVGMLGELLRREGLYSSHLTTWRRQRDEGVLSALEPKKRGRKSKAQDPGVQEAERLRRENQRLTERLRQAELIIEAQKKVSEILGTGPDGLRLRWRCWPNGMDETICPSATSGGHDGPSNLGKPVGGTCRGRRRGAVRGGATIARSRQAANLACRAGGGSRKPSHRGGHLRWRSGPVRNRPGDREFDRRSSENRGAGGRAAEPAPARATRRLA